MNVRYMMVSKTNFFVLCQSYLDIPILLRYTGTMKHKYVVDHLKFKYIYLSKKLLY